MCGHEAGVGWSEALFPACQSQKHFLFTEAGCCRGAAEVGGRGPGCSVHMGTACDPECLQMGLGQAVGWDSAAVCCWGFCSGTCPACS